MALSQRNMEKRISEIKHMRMAVVHETANISFLEANTFVLQRAMAVIRILRDVAINQGR